MANDQLTKMMDVARAVDARTARRPGQTIDLDALDASLRVDLAQQVKDGLITQAEADRIGDRLTLTNYTPEGK